MNIRYLPSLKSLNIKNFSLYPGALNFRYDFIEGINLIIGGNGVGKTTFLNLIKYALIGLYKKEIDVKRREYKGQEWRYDKRQNLSYLFFRSRMDDAVNYNQAAEVCLTFLINETEFQITRNLFEPQVKEVKIMENGVTWNMEGTVVTQQAFDNLFVDKKNNSQIFDTLQWKYEEYVGKVSNHEFFDNLIFLVNDVLFFSEARKTIMWDSTAQGKLSSKYFVDPQLDEQKEKAERDAKYYDSLARHKSEDIRAINKIFERFNETSTDVEQKHFNELVLEIEDEKQTVNAQFKQLDTIQRDRNQSELKLNIFHSDKNGLSKNLEDLEIQKRKEEQNIFSDLYKKVTPKYYDYLKYLKHSKDCPLCNQNLPFEIYQKVVSDESQCMMCGNPILDTQLKSEILTEIKANISSILLNIRNKEKEIIDGEEALKDLDVRFKNTTYFLNEAQSKLRKLEFAAQKANNENNPNQNHSSVSEFSAMKGRIDELEKEKDDAQQLSKKASKEANKVLEKIDFQRLQSRERLSEIFNKFGGQFLGVPCELVYDDPKDDEGKRYLPKINGNTRFYEEELSESQRFFIDQSFRMSLLNFFNSSSSFFMCETPDSSLDISYEKNAAKIFLEYIKQPNALIITSNLNNSEFLDYIIEKANAINYINLLTIGKQSNIQVNSSQLLQASKKIESIINGKRKQG